MLSSGGTDPRHGHRAELGLTDTQPGLLRGACEHHASGQTTVEPTVGVRWPCVISHEPKSVVTHRAGKPWYSRRVCRRARETSEMSSATA